MLYMVSIRGLPSAFTLFYGAPGGGSVFCADFKRNFVRHYTLHFLQGPAEALYACDKASCCPSLHSILYKRAKTL